MHLQGLSALPPWPGRGLDGAWTEQPRAVPWHPQGPWGASLVPAGGARGAQQAGPAPPGSGCCHLSLSCMPSSHACLRTKACTVCTPWPGPSPPPLPRGGVCRGRKAPLPAVGANSFVIPVSGASPTGTVEKTPGSPSLRGEGSPGWVVTHRAREAWVKLGSTPRPPRAATEGPSPHCHARQLCDLKGIKGHQQGDPHTQMFLAGAKKVVAERRGNSGRGGCVRA